MTIPPITSDRSQWTHEQQNKFDAHASLVIELQRAQSAFIAANQAMNALLEHDPPTDHKSWARMSAFYTMTGLCTPRTLPSHLGTIAFALTQTVVEAWMGRFDRNGKHAAPPKWPMSDPRVDELLQDSSMHKPFVDYRNAVFHMDDINSMTELEMYTGDQLKYATWAHDVIDAMTQYFIAYFERWRQSGAIPKTP